MLWKNAIALLAGAVSIYAQSGRNLIITEGPGATGGRDYTITNARDIPLTGFTVNVIHHSSSSPDRATLIYDSLANGPSQPALKQGDSYTWHFYKDSPGVPPTEYSVDAAIFADGLAIGDSAAVQSLWDRCQWTAVALRKAFRDLDSSVPDIENTDEAISILKPLHDHWVAPGFAREQRDAFINAYGTLIATFELVAELRARGKQKIAATRIAGLREWMNQKVEAIQSQVRPAQVRQNAILGSLLYAP